MTKMFIAGAVAALVAVGIGSCAAIEELRYVGAEAAGRAVAFECGLSLDERQKNLTAINGWLNGSGVTARATAFDCDGDGSPDF